MVNNVTLIAEPREFSELPYHFHIQASSRGRRLPNTMSSKREESTTSDELEKNDDISLNLQMPEEGGLSVDKTGGLLAEVKGKSPDVVVQCKNCSLHGGLDLDLEVHADLDSKSKLGGSISLNANDVGARIEVILSINSVLKDGINIQQPVLGYVPFGTGFYLPKIIDIGPTVILNFALSVGQNEIPVAIRTGFEFSLDPDAHFQLDFGDVAKSDSSGWNPKFKATEPGISEGEVALYAEVAPILQFVIAGKVLQQGAEAGIEMAGGNIQFRVDQSKAKDTCALRRSPRGMRGHSGHSDTSTQSAESTQSASSAQSSEAAQSSKAIHAANSTQHVEHDSNTGSHPDPDFIKLEFGMVNVIRAFADVNFFGAKASAGHDLASWSTQLYKTCTQEPSTMNRPTPVTNLILPSISTFEATAIWDAITEAGKTVSSVGSAIVSTVTDAVENAEQTAENVVTDTVVPTVTDAAKTAVSAIENVGDDIKDGFEDMGNSIKDGICEIFC